MTEASNQAETNKQDETTPIEKAIEIIKHPPAIDDAMRELSPEELAGNPAVAPQMIHEPSDLRDDIKRD